MQADPFFYSNPAFERLRSRPKKRFCRQEIPYRRAKETGFSCTHCHRHVTCDSSISGVRNRNHCPCCLWSRHVDLKTPGDRLGTCQARMQPVGLTLKRTNQKYGLEPDGELMLIHICEACGKISINRIAADDSASAILDVFRTSLKSGARLRARFVDAGIQLLRAADRKLVQTRLFGKSV